MKKYFQSASLMAIMMVLLLFASFATADGDTSHVLLEPEKSAEANPVRDTDLYNECREDKRAPWCYEEKVVAMKKPELCANITKHWGAGAGGVEGYCYYEIAKKTKDCALCKKIKNSQIRNNLCKRDVCRK